MLEQRKGEFRRNCLTVLVKLYFMLDNPTSTESYKFPQYIQETNVLLNDAAQGLCAVASPLGRLLRPQAERMGRIGRAAQCPQELALGHLWPGPAARLGPLRTRRCPAWQCWRGPARGRARRSSRSPLERPSSALRFRGGLGLQCRRDPGPLGGSGR